MWVCVCVWLGDLTAGKSVIELLIVSDLMARLAFLFHFMLLYIFFRLSCGRVQYVTPEGTQITAHYKHSWQSRAHKHRCTDLHFIPPIYTQRMWRPPCLSGHPTVQTATWAPMWPGEFSRQQDSRAGQQHLMPSPHLVHPSPGLTSSLTHCLSPRRTATLRRARQDERWWTGRLLCELSPSPANVMDRQLAVTQSNRKRKQS